MSRTASCKVPQKITVIFWIVKCSATTVGGTVSEYFNVNLSFGLIGAAALFFPLLILDLIIQFSFPKYIPTVYWLGIVFMSICGTIFADGLHDLEVELWLELIVFSLIVGFCFLAWYKVEGSLDIHSIYTSSRECFYWMTILFTFSLGTSVGELVAKTTGLGFGVTLAIFAGIIIIVALLWKYKWLGEITSFWFTYVMTRPLGASAGSLISTYIGEGATSLLFSVIIIGCIIYLSITKIDQVDIRVTPRSEQYKPASKKRITIVTMSTDRSLTDVRLGVGDV